MRTKMFYPPVYVTRVDNVTKNTLNAWREWSWDGPDPNNLRIMRFYSLIELN